MGRVYLALNEAVGDSSYLYEGIDTIGNTLQNDSAVKRFLASEGDPQQ
jgi:hypothetical protein